MNRYTPEERSKAFNGKAVPVTETGCWLWVGSVGLNGYGRFWNGERHVYAHRYSYETHAGEIPVGRQIDHLCGVRCCVNPAHLEPVTCRDNLARANVWSLPRRSANAEKTHCAQGHEYTAENTHTKADGSRNCRACARDAQLKRTRARKGLPENHPSMANAIKTHCKHGHPLSGGNLYVSPSTGSRQCVKCRRDCKSASRRSA